jgi:hypothetical protein
MSKMFTDDDRTSKNSNRIEEIDNQLRDQVVELVDFFTGAKGKRRGDEMRWGKKGGLAVMVAGPNKGRITPFDGDGKGKSPFQYIQVEMNLSFPDAVDWAANWLGISPGYKPDPEVERIRKEKRDRDRKAAEAIKEREEAGRIAKAVAIWNSAQVVE